MPLHKIRPMARRPCGRSNSDPASGSISSHSSTTTDKSSQAARMAQQLASQSSWADAFAPATPATNATPATSVADTESQADLDDQPPPSYEDARLERELPSIPQSRQENVRQSPSPVEVSHPNVPRDVEAGVSTPLLCRTQGLVKARKRRQRRFIFVFIVLAVWLMGCQAIKGFGTGFWRSDGTPIPPLPRRSYTRHETSSTISGTFTFYDELDLSTTSGTINIVIDPQPGDKIGVIRLTSRSGTIRVKFSDEYMNAFTSSGILDRTFDLEARSSSGSQVIEIPQGNGGVTSLISDSGSINTKLFTTHLGKNASVTTLNTQSNSASQTIKVKALSPEPITSLAANLYAKGSGTIKLFLPSVWQGMVHASSAGSGGVEVKGDDLDFQRNGNKEIYAWRILKNQYQAKEPTTEGQVIEVIGEASGSIKVDCSAS